MSKFFEELWESIFTPGPTPSLLIATNVTFAVLQLVLSILLIATYSVHFVVLSFLSAGLWWAINWFARELAAAQKEQEEKEEDERRMQRRRAVVAAAAAASQDDSSDSETEVEEAKGKSTGASRAGDVRQRAAGAAKTAKAGTSASPGLTGTSSTAPDTSTSSLAAPAADTPSSKGSQHLSSRSGVSTEDEWEKVSENER